MTNAYLGLGLAAAVGIIFFFGFRAAPLGDTKLAALDFISKYQDTPGAVLVDVRTPEEYAEGHLKSSINIDIRNASFATEIATLDKSKTYFVYCRSGNRSAQAVAQMKAIGIEHIYDMLGGVSSNKGQLELITEETATSSDTQ